jgi:membrane-bound lytic murein transglycosylase B
MVLVKHYTKCLSSRRISNSAVSMKTKQLLLIVSFSSLFSLSSLVFADYASHEQASAFTKKLVTEHGFTEQEVNRVLSQAKKKDSILEAISRPAEKRLNWAEYRALFLNKSRIEKGKKFLQNNADVLSRAEEQFGVPKEIITAIIGVETRYGGNMGSYRVVDALATLGFDYPPRSKFFLKELEQFMLLAREQGFDPLELKGSYAGAMGYGQFISSSYRHYAVDFDEDGVADILANKTDAIGSVANYFKEHRWKPGGVVAERATFQGDDFKSLVVSDLKPKLTAKQLKGVGLQTPVLPEDADARYKILDLEGPDGQEQWVAHHNFYVITRYNHSHLYGMAVFSLAKELGF